MKRFQNILVCIDALADQQFALASAVRLAKHSGAGLKLIDVEEKLSPLYSTLLKKYAGLREGQRRHKLNEFAERYRGEGLNVCADLLSGRPFVEIVREVLRSGHDLVVKDAQGLAGHKNVLAGSVDMRLLRNCPCPVWLVKAAHAQRLRRILAAVDPEPDDERHSALNQVALRLASSTAELEQSQLHVAAVWDSPGEELLLGRVSFDRFSEFLRDAREKASDTLHQLLKQADVKIDKSLIHFQKGDAAEVITKIAKTYDVDLLVMGTVARTGIPGLLMGNTAEAVLRRVECSVLAIKPAGWVSPVHSQGHPVVEKMASNNLGWSC